MFARENSRKRLLYVYVISSLLLGTVSGYLLTTPQTSNMKEDIFLLNSSLQEEKLLNLNMNNTIIQYEHDISNYLLEILEFEETLADAEALIANQSNQIQNFDNILSKVNTRNSLYIVNSGIEIIEINPKTGDIITTYVIQHMIGDDYHASWPSGITYDGEHFWLAAADSDEILKLDPNDMSIVSIYDSPGPAPMGLTWDGEHLWCVDKVGPHSNARGKLYKLDRDTLEVIQYFSLFGKEPTGLTWDGNYLWVIEEGDEMSGPILRKIDPDTGYPPSTMNFPSIPDKFVGLAWEENYLWLSVSSHDSESPVEIGKIYKYYPKIAKLIEQFEIPPDSNIYAGLTLAPSSNYWIWDED